VDSTDKARAGALGVSQSGSRVFLAFCVLLSLCMVGCAQQYHQGQYGAGNGASQSFAPTQYYPPPGPPDDPWGPYIHEAAARYDIPEQWIRAVMNQESGGEEQAVSPVGAMGLMQIMPDTYEELQESEGLGADPFDPHNNILAGAAYIREMYDRYGSPGFLAAYNAGPDQLDSYLAGGSDLPAETVNYLAAIVPNLGNEVPLSGPLANYTVANSSGTVRPPTPANFASGCDVDAAYDPDQPCTAESSVVAASEQAAISNGQVSAGSCDLNAAYDPDSPCIPETTSSGPQAASTTGSCNLNVAYDPDNPCASAAPSVPAPVEQVAIQQSTPPSAPASASPPVDESALYQPAAITPTSSSHLVVSGTGETPAPQTIGGPWAIQVGAFSSQELARTVAEGARAELPGEMTSATVSTPATTPFGGLVLYRARLTNLSTRTAVDACMQLNQRQLPCIVIAASAS
jgi:D-alanyl-D-alanine carboxypeptidase